MRPMSDWLMTAVGPPDWPMMALPTGFPASWVEDLWGENPVIFVGPRGFRVWGLVMVE